MVVRSISATGVRVLMFAAFLVLLTVFPRFCTSVPEPETTVVDPEPVPPSEGPMAGEVLKKMTTTIVSKSEKRKFTPQDRRQIEQEASILEWDLCREKKPSADFCRVTSVQVSPTSDGRAVAKIYFEYHYANWESSTPKTFRATRIFERFADGWVPAE